MCRLSVTHTLPVRWSLSVLKLCDWPLGPSVPACPAGVAVGTFNRSSWTHLGLRATRHRPSVSLLYTLATGDPPASLPQFP